MDNKKEDKTVTLVSDTTNWKSAEEAKIANVSAKKVIGNGTKATTIKVSVDDDGIVTIGGYKAVDGNQVSGSTGN